MSALTGLSGLGGLSSLCGGRVTRVDDAFTDANGTNITAHSIAPVNVPGTSWTPNSGTWTINNNKVSAGADHFCTCDPGVSDGEVTAVINVASGLPVPAVLGRWTDASNHWQAVLYTPTPELQLIETNAGTTTQRAAASVSWAAGQDHTVGLSFAGSSISTLYDGVVKSTYSSSFNQSATRAGMRSRANVTHDDFRVAV